MPIIKSKKAEEDAILIAAKLMAASARTAPKTQGVDRIVTMIITGEEKENVAKAMEQKAKQKKIFASTFNRNAEDVRNSTAVLLVGVKGTVPKPEKPIDCGACGYHSCAEFIKAEKKMGEDFIGPVCMFEAMDLGIALGSAVKMASEMNIDNRLMYTIGAAVKTLNLMEADVIIGIPLSVSGKNIFFDR